MTSTRLRDPTALKVVSVNHLPSLWVVDLLVLAIGLEKTTAWPLHLAVYLVSVNCSTVKPCQAGCYLRREISEIASLQKASVPKIASGWKRDLLRELFQLRCREKLVAFAQKQFFLHVFLHPATDSRLQPVSLRQDCSVRYKKPFFMLSLFGVRKWSRVRRRHVTLCWLLNDLLECDRLSLCIRSSFGLCWRE